MADKQQRLPLWGLLMCFVLLVACVVMTGLYFDLRHKFASLEAKNSELEASQVLLMVPEGQAEALAAWLESHPSQTQQLLQRMEPVSQPPYGDASAQAVNTEIDAVSKPGSASDAQLPNTSNQKLESENEDGVKVIVLPHGGIRVTTREEKN
ncbi:membrane anchored protein in chemotaxis locus [Shewanella sp.]|uniref:membrane anchored protein in chemotaxis locus n=1 Tax=Shewanella sp. TaxID=50422 RepID=UPI0035613F55